MKKLVLGLGLATLVIAGCSKDDSADLPAPQPAPANKVSVEAAPAVAMASPTPNTPPASNTATSDTNPGWKPGDGEPAAGKFPPAVQRDLGIDGSPNLDNLTLAMRDWSYYTDRFPNDMNELVTSKYLLSIPTPPPGKKYAVNASTASVILVSSK